MQLGPDAEPDVERIAVSAGRKRQVSSIAFPYDDLDEAIKLASAIHSNGGLQARLDQLSAWLGHDSMSSGAFRVKLSVARVFGLIETDRERVTLTPLARRIVDPQQARAARVDAFLTVPLYRALFDRFRGNLLPSDAGLEEEMVRLGVSTKQKERARQVFQRSAAQADFFAHGKDRLVLPTGVPSDTRAAAAAESTEQPRPAPAPAVSGGSAPSGVGHPSLHPAIEGLLLTLPPPGGAWPQEKREQWLEAAKMIFALVYQDPET